jgi:hypothetical protein
LSQHYITAADLDAIRFRVWLPGADLLALPVLVPQRDYADGVGFDLILVSSSPAAGSSSVSAPGLPLVPASAPEPLFIPACMGKEANKAYRQQAERKRARLQ